MVTIVVTKEGEIMPRKTYTAKEKENALRLCEEIGVQKASEETGISVNSLYAWRGGKKANKAAAIANDAEIPVNAPAANDKKTGASRKQSGVGENPDEELIRLRIENEALKAQNKTLKNALRPFTE